MEIKDMTAAELEARKAELASVDLETLEGDALNDVETEAREINEELETRKAVEAQKAEIRTLLAEGKAPEAETIEEIQEERKMSDMEIRNSKEYIDAYAEYIKTGDDAECRGLLTENATNGTVPVPELVYGLVKTAWDREGITRRVRKAYIKGNLKVGFEISSTDAAIHTEGGDPVSEETLVLGTVELVPQSIKKFITISDEVYDMRGEEFLRYIYDELTYRIAKKLADEIVAAIEACDTVSTTTCPSVAAITATTITMGLTADAISQLSDEAARPVIMMNKATWAKFKAVEYANGYGVDPFEGLEVEFNNSITSFDAATTGVTYMIVGDLDHGALVNLPNGGDTQIKFDDKTLMTNDMIRVLGRLYAGVKVVAPKAFVKVTK